MSDPITLAVEREFPCSFKECNDHVHVPRCLIHHREAATRACQAVAEDVRRELTYAASDLAHAQLCGLNAAELQELTLFAMSYGWKHPHGHVPPAPGQEQV